MKIRTKSRILGWKQQKFQQNQHSFGSRNSETDASRAHVVCTIVLMRHDYLRSSKAGKPAGPQMRLQWDQV